MGERISTSSKDVQTLCRPYSTKILLSGVRLFRDAVNQDFLLLDDTATPYRTEADTELLKREDIQNMDRSVISHELNLIEYM